MRNRFSTAIPSVCVDHLDILPLSKTRSIQLIALATSRQLSSRSTTTMRMVVLDFFSCSLLLCGSLWGQLASVMAQSN